MSYTRRILYACTAAVNGWVVPHKRKCIERSVRKGKGKFKDGDREQRGESQQNKKKRKKMETQCNKVNQNNERWTEYREVMQNELDMKTKDEWVKKRVNDLENASETNKSPKTQDFVISKFTFVVKKG